METKQCFHSLLFGCDGELFYNVSLRRRNEECWEAAKSAGTSCRTDRL